MAVGQNLTAGGPQILVHVSFGYLFLTHSHICFTTLNLQPEMFAAASSGLGWLARYKGFSFKAFIAWLFFFLALESFSVIPTESPPLKDGIGGGGVVTL